MSFYPEPHFVQLHDGTRPYPGNGPLVHANSTVVGAEIMNHSGIRIFQHLGDLAQALPAIYVESSTRLIPIGIAFVLDTTQPIFVPRGPHLAETTANAAMQDEPGRRAYPAHISEHDQHERHAPGRLQFPTWERAWRTGRGGEDPCSQQQQDHQHYDAAPAAVGAGRDVGRRVDPGRSRKRRHDEYTAGDASPTGEGVGIPEGWHKCGCCAGGWYYVEEEDRDLVGVESQALGRGRGTGCELDGDASSGCSSEVCSREMCSSGGCSRMEDEAED